jgi:hypothetical protein
MLPLYKPLDYDYYSRIQQEGTMLALELDLIHNPTTQVANPVELDLLREKVPNLTIFLNKYGWTMRSASIMVMREQSTTGIYCEAANSDAKVEIPLIGCQYSETVYYQARVTGTKRLLTGVDSWTCDPSTAREIGRFTLTKPTIVRTLTPHETVLTRVHVRRISLVLDVGPDAYSLLTATSQ